MVYDRVVNNELIIKIGWEIFLGIYEEGMILWSELKYFIINNIRDEYNRIFEFFLINEKRN